MLTHSMTSHLSDWRLGQPTPPQWKSPALDAHASRLVTSLQQSTLLHMSNHIATHDGDKDPSAQNMCSPAVLTGRLGFIEVVPVATEDEVHHYYPTEVFLTSFTIPATPESSILPVPTACSTVGLTPGFFWLTSVRGKRQSVF